MKVVAYVDARNDNTAQDAEQQLEVLSGPRESFDDESMFLHS